MNLEQRIIDYIKNNPIEHEGKTLTIENLILKMPDMSIDHQLLLKLKGEGNLEGVIRGKVVVKDSLTKAVISQGNTMNIMKFPIKTERGTYIINGVEKNVLNQMRLKSGCYSTRDSAAGKIKTNLTFSRPKNKMYMPQMSLILNTSTSPTFTATIKEANFNILNFLWILGFTDQETEDILGKGHVASSLIEKYAKKVQAHSPRKLLGTFIGNETKVANLTDDQAREQIWNFINGSAKFDEEVVNATVGVKTSTLNKQVIENAIAKTIALAENPEQPDDNKDDLKFKIVDSDDDLMLNQFIKSYDTFTTTASKTLLSNKTINAKTFLGVTKLGDGIKDFLAKSNLVQTPEEINPLFLDTMNRKITQMGDGGMSRDSARKEVNARNITMSSINKIDPVETPESTNIGLVQHLTSGVEVEGGTLKIKVFKVKNGIAEKVNPIKFSSIEEEDKVIAYYDTRYMEDRDKKIIFTKPQIPCRFKGSTKDFPIKEIQYVDTSATNLVGTATNMIPFLMHDDGNRAMMGAKMLTQATSIKNKEIPLVATLADKDTGLTFEQKVGSEFGKPVLSTVNGVVDTIENSKIIVRDKKNKLHEFNYYRYYPLTQGYMNNELKVKIGDIVEPGTILAEGWQTKEGSLALGKNTRVGYLSYKGFNYEDGVVISQSYAKAMASEDVNTYSIEIPANAMGGQGSNVMNELKKYTTDASILKLDKDGIIQEGEYIKAGNIIAAVLVPLENSSSLLDQIMNEGNKEGEWRLKPIAIDPNSYVSGKIVRKTVIDNPSAYAKQKIVLTLLKSEDLKVGDKVAGRHGNKGTITKVLPDNLMPVAEDGKAFELLFSPLAIPSRKNTGQIFEVNAGLIAEKTGRQIKVENFNFDEKNKVLKELEELGYKGGKMKVTLKEEDEKGNIVEIKGENPVTTGNMYVMKLKHKVDDKIQSRSNFEGPGISMREKMPTKTVGAAAGEKHNPQSIGEMEMRALQGHNAVWNILESTTLKADGGGGREERIALFRALATGKIEGEDLMNKSTTPETVQIMSDKLKALGLNLKPFYKGRMVGSLSRPFDSVGIAPLNPDEFLKTVGPQHEITKHTDFLNARSLYNDTGKKDSEKVYISGGLMDPEIFGNMSEEESRSKWGYIKLATPIPNPVLLSDGSYNPYSILTGIKRLDLVNIVSGKAVVIGNEADIDNTLKDLPEELKLEYKKEINNNMQELGYKAGDIIKLSDYEKNVSSKGLIIPTRAGSDFLKDKLSSIDVNTSLAEAYAELDNAKGAKIDSAYKKVRVLQNLSNNKIKPADLLMTYVPVMPLYLRPITINKEENKVESDDLNKIYSKIIHANNTLKEGVLDSEGHIDFLKSGKDAVDSAKGVAAVYNAVAGLSGKVEAKDIKTGKPLTDIKLGGKEGLVRGKMLSKRVDFSGRSVIGVDPNLRLDEAGIPLDIAKNIYKPFAIKELVSRGYAPTEQEARKMLKGDSPHIKKVLQDIAIDRPILLNRQPSLHKYSIQALTPIIKDKEDGSVVRSIQLNPLVVTGYNADFDGDTMAVHVPITEKAKEEAKKLMMPSQNLINPTDGKMIIELRHEMLLGLYQMTSGWNKPIGTTKIYNDFNKLRTDYFMGKVHSRQKIKVPICPHETTAGIAIFNWCIPEKVKSIPSVRGGMTGRNFKKAWGKKEVSELFASIYAEAEKTNFELLSKTQISLLLDRFKDLGFKASTIGSVSLGADDFIKVKNISNKIEQAAQAGSTIGDWTKLEKEIEKQIQGGVLSDDNPLQIMMQSGARANPGQIRRMLFTQGVGMDVAKNLKKPIKESLFDGLSTKDFFLMGSDARKGMYDRSVSTTEPGALARKVWSAVQDVVIKDTDCNTKDYTVIKKSNAPSVKGRIAGADIVGSDGKIICKRNVMITNDIYSKIFADNAIQFVPIRSPLRCKTVNGVCQKCYGAMPGTNELVKVGSSIGVLASQALGEPVTQMTMNTFHTGGANSAASLGLPRVQKILQLGKDKQYGAVISKTTGIVKEIKDTDSSIDVVIEKATYKVPKDLTGKAPKIKVKVGDSVKAGDFLTVGDSKDILMYNNDDGVSIALTNADPRALLQAKTMSLGKDKALQETQDYLTNTMQHAFEASNSSFDRRHMETIISKLTQNAKVLDPGDSNLLKGQEIDASYIKKWNEEHSSPMLAKVVDVKNTRDIINRVVAENVKDKTGKVLVPKGTLITLDMIPTLSVNVQNPKVKVMPKLIEYDYSMKGTNTVDDVGHDNWLSNLGGENVYRQIARGASFGQVDKLQDPRSRLMTGKLLNIGEGIKVPEEAKHEIGSSMMNFLNNHADKIIKKHGVKK